MRPNSVKHQVNFLFGGAGGWVLNLLSGMASKGSKGIKVSKESGGRGGAFGLYLRIRPTCAARHLCGPDCAAAALVARRLPSWVRQLDR